MDALLYLFGVFGLCWFIFMIGKKGWDEGRAEAAIEVAEQTAQHLHTLTGLSIRSCRNKAEMLPVETLIKMRQAPSNLALAIAQRDNLELTDQGKAAMQLAQLFGHDTTAN